MEAVQNDCTIKTRTFMLLEYMLLFTSGKKITDREEDYVEKKPVCSVIIYPTYITFFT